MGGCSILPVPGSLAFKSIVEEEPEEDVVIEDETLYQQSGNNTSNIVFCSLNRTEKLTKADALMRKIVGKAVDEKGKLKKNLDPDLYKAGSELYKLTLQIYKNKVTPANCQKQIQSVMRHLEHSNIDLAKQ